MKYFLLLSTCIHLFFIAPVFFKHNEKYIYSYKVSVSSLKQQTDPLKKPKSVNGNNKNEITSQIKPESITEVIDESNATTTTEAQIINDFDKYYPENARVNEIEGFVELKIFITQNAIISKIEIIKSSGAQILDLAAIKAVRNSQIKPATVNKSPVDSEKYLKVEFRLRN